MLYKEIRRRENCQYFLKLLQQYFCSSTDESFQLSFFLIYHVVKIFAQLLPLWEYFPSKLWKWLIVNSAATGHSAGSYSSNDTRVCLTGLVFRQIQTLGALPRKCLDHKESFNMLAGKTLRKINLNDWKVCFKGGHVENQWNSPPKWIKKLSCLYLECFCLKTKYLLI